MAKYDVDVGQSMAAHFVTEMITCFRDIGQSTVGQSIQVRIDIAHNDLLNMAINQGIPCMALYSAVWIT